MVAASTMVNWTETTKERMRLVFEMLLENLWHIPEQ
jgi:hypothetical protein